MTGSRSQSGYQVRLGWGSLGLAELAEADIVVVVDAIGASGELAAKAAGLPHGPTVFLGSMRKATATAQAAFDEQVARSGPTSINLVLAGDEGRFAVEDYLAAGANCDALTAFGFDHSAPDVAVATEGFRPLERALRHLFSASASGLALVEAGHKAVAKAAAELDADTDAIRFAV